MSSKVVIWEAQNFMGGGQLLAIEVAKALSKQYQVSFLIPGTGDLTDIAHSKGYETKNYKSVTFSRGKKTPFDFVKFFLAFPFEFLQTVFLIGSNRPKLLYVNAAKSFIYSAIIGLLLGIPVIWHVHNYFQDANTRRLLHFFSKFSSVKQIVCASPALEVQFDKKVVPTSSIYPSVDVNSYPIIPDDQKLDVREYLSIPEDYRIFIQISWVGEAKGQDVTLDAFYKIAEKIDKVALVFVGTMPDKESVFCDKLETYVKKHGLDEKVHFVGHQNEIRPYLDEAYINVIASFEGFSLTMVEAGLFGVCTIAPNVGGPSVVLKDGEQGIIYQFNNSESLAQAMLRLLQDQEEKDRLDKASKEFMKQFSLERYHEEVHALVVKLL